MSPIGENTMSIILKALKNRDLRDDKSNMEILDDWDVGQLDPVISEHDEAISLGPQSFITHTYTTLYLVLARKINTTSANNDEELLYAKEQAAKSIHFDVYGELLSELDKVLYHIEYSGKKESKKHLMDVISKWKINQ